MITPKVHKLVQVFLKCGKSNAVAPFLGLCYRPMLFAKKTLALVKAKGVSVTERLWA